jgi:hypothetical protein
MCIKISGNNFITNKKTKETLLLVPQDSCCKIIWDWPFTLKGAMSRFFAIEMFFSDATEILFSGMCIKISGNNFITNKKKKPNLVIFNAGKNFRSKIRSWACPHRVPPELQIKKNSCQTLGPASKRVLPDLSTFCQTYFFFCLSH